MSTQHRVALVYGSSVFLKGITEALRSRADWRIVELGAKSAPAQVAETFADVVFVDNVEITPTQLERLIEKYSPRPIPSIIRFDAESQQLLALSARHWPAVHITDLTQAIDSILASISE